MTRLEALTTLKEAVEAGVRPAQDGSCYKLFGDAWVHVYDIYSNGSLDAAKALHEVVLPEWDFALMTRRKHKDTAATVSPPFFQGSYEWHCNKDPARAWLLATLSALIAMETNR